MAAASTSPSWISVPEDNAEACPAAADSTAVSTDHATASTFTGETLRRWYLIYFVSDLTVMLYCKISSRIICHGWLICLATFSACTEVYIPFSYWHSTSE